MPMFMYHGKTRIASQIRAQRTENAHEHFRYITNKRTNLNLNYCLREFWNQKTILGPKTKGQNTK